MPILKEIKQHRILIDTHVWIWIVAGDKKLSKKFLNDFEKIRTTSGFLVSPLSIWEIGMLVRKKKIEIGSELGAWIDTAMNHQGFQLAPITPQIAIQSSSLPTEVHGDPVDRMLIATAREERAVLITCDTKILDFGKGKFVSVYDPCKK